MHHTLGRRKREATVSPVLSGPEEIPPSPPGPLKLSRRAASCWSSAPAPDGNRVTRVDSADDNAPSRRPTRLSRGVFGGPCPCILCPYRAYSRAAFPADPCVGRPYTRDGDTENNSSRTKRTNRLVWFV